MFSASESESRIVIRAGPELKGISSKNQRKASRAQVFEVLKLIASLESSVRISLSCQEGAGMSTTMRKISQICLFLKAFTRMRVSVSQLLSRSIVLLKYQSDTSRHLRLLRDLGLQANDFILRSSPGTKATMTQASYGQFQARFTNPRQIYRLALKSQRLECSAKASFAAAKNQGAISCCREAFVIKTSTEVPSCLIVLSELFLAKSASLRLRLRTNSWSFVRELRSRTRQIFLERTFKEAVRNSSGMSFSDEQCKAERRKSRGCQFKSCCKDCQRD